MCESGGGRPGLPVPNSPYGLCGRKATLNLSLKTEEEKTLWGQEADTRSTRPATLQEQNTQRH